MRERETVSDGWRQRKRRETERGIKEVREKNIDRPNKSE